MLVEWKNNLIHVSWPNSESDSGITLLSYDLALMTDEDLSQFCKAVADENIQVLCDLWDKQN